MFSMYLSNNSNIGQHKIFQKYEHKKKSYQTQTFER